MSRGQVLKRYVRSAAALQGLYDDVALANEVGRTRTAVGKWWTGVRPEPAALARLADATGLSVDDLTRFVYFDGPPPLPPQGSGPAGLQEGVQRVLGHPDEQGPDMHAPSPPRLPRDAEAERG